MASGLVDDTELPIHVLREAWLHHAAELMAPMFAATGSPLPEKIRISCGFPSARATSEKGKYIGMCYPPSMSADGTVEIMISPVLAEPLGVLATLAHELVHGAVGTECGHKGPFRRVAQAIGLVGPMRATVAGDQFKAAMKPVLEVLGPYPHAVLNASTRKKQSTRLLKAECMSMDDADENEGKHCGYTVRITKVWVMTLGAPHCPLHGEMHVSGLESETGEDADSEGSY
jgi:hypothetical protein